MARSGSVLAHGAIVVFTFAGIFGLALAMGAMVFWLIGPIASIRFCSFRGGAIHYEPKGAAA